MSQNIIQYENNRCDNMNVDDLWEILTNHNNETISLYMKGNELINVYPNDEIELFHSREGISSHTLTVDKGECKLYINIKDITYIEIGEEF